MLPALGMLVAFALLVAPVSSKWTNLVPSELTPGRVVVPTLARYWGSRDAFIKARGRLFAEGLYPGVDYRIENTSPGLVTVRPCYPLVAKLERDWPVTVAVTLAPRWMDPAAYNVLTAGFSFALAAGGLLVGFAASSLVTLSVISSTSMAPTILPGDVLLVEKLTPRLGPSRAGQLVFFKPPDALSEIVAQREVAAASLFPSDSQPSWRAALPRPASSSRLFVKRVAAVAGDQVSVSPTGAVRVGGARGGERRVEESRPPDGQGTLARLVRPAAFEVPPSSYFVLGDNTETSIDSRCWGLLPADKVVGRPLLRVGPLSRFGPVK